MLIWVMTSINQSVIIIRKQIMKQISLSCIMILNPCFVNMAFLNHVKLISEGISLLARLWLPRGDNYGTRCMAYKITPRIICY